MNGHDAIDHSSHGVFAKHPEAKPGRIMLAPSAGSEFNTLKLPLVVVACALLPDSHFEFGSSIVKPDVAYGLARLELLLRKHPGAPLSLFGHADPVGNDTFNKELSGRRVKAIYGLLTHAISHWEDLYGKAYGSDEWGDKAIQIMLGAVGYDPGRDDGVMDDGANAALKKFRQDKGVNDDRSTRKALFTAYMDFLYGGKFTKLDPKDFLAQNADPDGKGDYQGCSEFNPLLVFSRDEDARFKKSSDKTDRNFLNAPSRRVLVFLFKPGTVATPKKWPCPSIKQNISTCKNFLYPDESVRRNPQTDRREYRSTKDTFACSFYDQIAQSSPCESAPLIFPTVRRRLVVRPNKENFVVVLRANGSAHPNYPVLEFQISNGPPNHLLDVQLTRGAPAELSGGPGLPGAWNPADNPATRQNQTAFSSWSAGEHALRLDASGKAKYKMPLEWWKDLARIPLNVFPDPLEIRYRVLSFPDATLPMSAISTLTAAGESAPIVNVRNDLVSFQVVDLGYTEGGITKSIRMEFTVREKGTTEMYTLVQWMQGSYRMWQGAGSAARFPPHILYDIRHDSNFPDFTIDRLHRNPRYWDGAYDSADGLTASATDGPNQGQIAAPWTHFFSTIDFETRVHLNCDVPAAVNIIRQDGSPPTYGVVTGNIQPEALLLASEVWNTRVLQVLAGGVTTVTHPNDFAGP